MSASDYQGCRLCFVALSSGRKLIPLLQNKNCWFSRQINTHKQTGVVLSNIVPYSQVSHYRSNEHHPKTYHTRAKQHFTTHVSANTCNMIKSRFATQTCDTTNGHRQHINSTRDMPYVNHQPTSKATPRFSRNVSEALGLLQRLLFYRIDNECKSHIQMRILIEYHAHAHSNRTYSMHWQIHDIAKAKGQRVPEVHSDRMRPVCKDYKSYSF